MTKFSIYLHFTLMFDSKLLHFYLNQTVQLGIKLFCKNYLLFGASSASNEGL